MRAFLLIIACLLLSGCAGMRPEDFAKSAQHLTLEEYFSGHTKAWGLFEDRFGVVKRQFTVDIDGVWADGVLTLTENFRYDDGETEQRVWTIHKTAPDHYEGRADNVVGTAQGISAGNALNWRYAFNLKLGDGHLQVDFDDWMFLQPDNVLINRAHVSKWGVEVGSVTLAFLRS